MNRYILFTGFAATPSGGWNDYYDSYETVAEAIEAAELIKTSYTWYHILDSETRELVEL